MGSCRLRSGSRHGTKGKLIFRVVEGARRLHTLLFLSLPLDTAMLTITELLPKVQKQQAASASSANSAIIDMLRSANLDDILPKNTPLFPRKFMVSIDCAVLCLAAI